MKKKLEIVCGNCESEFTLSYKYGNVEEKDDLFCPFCGVTLRELEEDFEDEYEEPVQNFDDPEWED
jgi:rRNA maturation endonuclease Nob1